MKNSKLFVSLIIGFLTVIFSIVSLLSYDNIKSIAKLSKHQTAKLSDISILTSIHGTFIDNIHKAKLGGSSEEKIVIDSLAKQNTIVVWENETGDILITLKLLEKDQNIRITVWNMLGKIVIEDYSGNYKDFENEHIIKASSSLNRGAYLIRVQGDKSRLDAKFIKSR